MGRHRYPRSQVRKHVVVARFNDPEYRAVRQRLRETGIKPSEIGRQLLLAWANYLRADAASTEVPS